MNGSDDYQVRMKGAAILKRITGDSLASKRRLQPDSILGMIGIYTQPCCTAFSMGFCTFCRAVTQASISLDQRIPDTLQKISEQLHFLPIDNLPTGREQHLKALGYFHKCQLDNTT